MYKLKKKITSKNIDTEKLRKGFECIVSYII